MDLLFCFIKILLMYFFKKHRGFTAVTWVRFPYGSPQVKQVLYGLAFLFYKNSFDVFF